MVTDAELRDLAARPRRYWHVDGIPELVMGLVWLLWGGALLLGEALPRGTAYQVYWLAVPAVLVLSGVAANWGVRQLKSRLTYPRTGYVEYLTPRPLVRILTALVAIGTAAAAAALVVTVRTTGAVRSPAAVMGVLISLAFLVLSAREKAPHLLVLAAVALALGIAFGTIGLGWSNLNWLIVALGLASAGVGGWRLRRYLKRHPVAVA